MSYLIAVYFYSKAVKVSQHHNVVHVTFLTAIFDGPISVVYDY